MVISTEELHGSLYALFERFLRFPTRVLLGFSTIKVGQVNVAWRFERSYKLYLIADDFLESLIVFVH
jgi:hypothetical protein